MAITAKELANKLKLSQTAVSMALNNKPGVSTATRQLVIKTAEECGFDFTKLKHKDKNDGTVYMIFYKAHNAILSYTPIFNELYEGAKAELSPLGFSVRVVQFSERSDKLEDLFSDLRVGKCSGIILVGTEISRSACKEFIDLGFPLVLLDSYFESLDVTSVGINNSRGAYAATDFLINQTGTQPGYLKSSYRIPNFTARQEGYFAAIKENGMSRSRSIVHQLSPEIEDAMADMLDIIDEGASLAKCYFADNDILAIGAIKAFKLRGFKVPEDVAVIGFDNITEGRIIEPALTTMDVPRKYIGRCAAKQLVDIIEMKSIHPQKVEISTSMIKRLSHSR